MNSQCCLVKRNFNRWRRRVGERHGGWVYVIGVTAWPWVIDHGHKLVHQAGPAYLELCRRYGMLHILTSPLAIYDGVLLLSLYVLTVLALPLSLFSTKRLVELL